MKPFLNAWLALVLVGGAAGCVDLDEKLVSSLGSGYATSQQGLTDLTNGIYAGVRGYDGGDAYYGMEVLGTDTWTAADQVAAGGAQPWVYLDTYDAQYNSLGAFLNAQWQAGYTIIARANVVLDNGPSTPIGGVLTQAIKDSRLGEAHFLRAWAYFQLVQQYGDLTINLHSGQLSTEAVREPEDSVYKVIIDDLNQAINFLPATQSDFGRVTLGAAQHLLAKVYLTRAYRDWNTANKQADFQQALTLANSVINSGTYSLVPIYADLWCGTHRAAAPPDPGRQGFCDVTNGFSERNSEIIWSIQFSYDPVQYTNTATNYNPVVFLSQYDGGAGGWAAGAPSGGSARRRSRSRCSSRRAAGRCPAAGAWTWSTRGSTAASRRSGSRTRPRAIPPAPARSAPAARRSTAACCPAARWGRRPAPTPPWCTCCGRCRIASARRRRTASARRAPSPRTWTAERTTTLWACSATPTIRR